MKIGISTASLFCVRETEDAFADLARMGCEVAEVFFASSCEYGRAFCASVDTCGIEVHSVHALGTQFEPELFSAHHRVREDAERVLR
ncbi:MAG: hypothetical protein LBM78_01065, partial [Clostridiales bacterium]|nr:hypothetical protein [Clostridiales bacterium]